jgi:hypothetical protein
VSRTGGKGPAVILIIKIRVKRKRSVIRLVHTFFVRLFVVVVDDTPRAVLARHGEINWSDGLGK